MQHGHGVWDRTQITNNDFFPFFVPLFLYKKDKRSLLMTIYYFTVLFHFLDEKSVIIIIQHEDNESMIWICKHGLLKMFTRKYLCSNL